MNELVMKFPYKIVKNKKGNSLIKCHYDAEGTCIIPEGIDTIKSNAFSYCPNITGIVIPEGVTHIENNAINNCRNLESISIPGSLVRIDEDIFYDLENLKEIIIGEGVTEIGPLFFRNFPELKTFKLPKTLKNICCQSVSDDEDNKLDSARKKSINRIIRNQEKREGCDVFEYHLLETTENGINIIHTDIMYISKYKGKEEKVVIPSKMRGVEKIIIGLYAFYGCNFIKELIIPKNVLKLERSALADCTNLNYKRRAEYTARYGKDVFAPY